MLRGPELKERFPELALTTDYTIEDDYIRARESGLYSIYDVLMPRDPPKRLLIPSDGGKRKYFSSLQYPDILIALLAPDPRLHKAFLPTSKESELNRTKIYKMRNILPSLRRISSNEKAQLRFHTVNYVNARLREMLDKQLETRRLELF